MKNDKMVVEGFYQKVAEILRTQHTYNDHRPMRRWNRQLGNGRYPGHGVVRIYGDVVVSMLRNPAVIGTYKQEDFFKALEEATR